MISSELFALLVTSVYRSGVCPVLMLLGNMTLTQTPKDRFPAVNNLIQRINLRKRRDSLILGGVIGICTILLLLYAFHWRTFSLDSDNLICSQPIKEKWVGEVSRADKQPAHDGWNISMMSKVYGGRLYNTGFELKLQYFSSPSKTISLSLVKFCLNIFLIPCLTTR